MGSTQAPQPLDTLNALIKQAEQLKRKSQPLPILSTSVQMPSIVSTMKPQPIKLNTKFEVSILDGSDLVEEVTHSSTPF